LKETKVEIKAKNLEKSRQEKIAPSKSTEAAKKHSRNNDQLKQRTPLVSKKPKTKTEPMSPKNVTPIKVPDEEIKEDI
jgi:hypothetical protein